MKDAHSKISPYVMPGIPRPQQSELTRIMGIVSRVTGVSESEILSSSRRMEKVKARHLFFWFAKKTGASLKSIGEHCGGRDHSTVLHGITTVKDLLFSRDKVITQFEKEIKIRL